MDQKTYFAKVDRSTKKFRGRNLSRPRRPFWGPLAAILDFTAIFTLTVKTGYTDEVSEYEVVLSLMMWYYISQLLSQRIILVEIF